MKGGVLCSFLVAPTSISCRQTPNRGQTTQRQTSFLGRQPPSPSELFSLHHFPPRTFITAFAFHSIIGLLLLAGPQAYSACHIQHTQGCFSNRRRTDIFLRVIRPASTFFQLAAPNQCGTMGFIKKYRWARTIQPLSHCLTPSRGVGGQFFFFTVTDRFFGLDPLSLGLQKIQVTQRQRLRKIFFHVAAKFSLDSKMADPGG